MSLAGLSLASVLEECLQRAEQLDAGGAALPVERVEILRDTREQRSRCPRSREPPSHASILEQIERDRRLIPEEPQAPSPGA